MTTAHHQEEIDALDALQAYRFTFLQSARAADCTPGAGPTDFPRCAESWSTAAASSVRKDQAADVLPVSCGDRPTFGGVI